MLASFSEKLGLDKSRYPLDHRNPWDFLYTLKVHPNVVSLSTAASGGLRKYSPLRSFSLSDNACCTKAAYVKCFRFSTAPKLQVLPGTSQRLSTGSLQLLSLVCFA